MPNANHAPHTVDSLLRVVEARDTEVALLKLLVDKLKVQLLRQVRARFGASSEQLDDPQIALIEGLPVPELAPVAKTPKAPAANGEGVDRGLPAHLPRENHVYRPEASHARHDAAGQACGRSACGGRLRQIGQDVSEQLEYTLTRLGSLTRYRDDGSIEIDNNAAERALRGVSLGRKNFMFMGSDAGGERAAAIYSLVETAKLNGLDPEVYLRDVLGRIADHPRSTASPSRCRGTSVVRMARSSTPNSGWPPEGLVPGRLQPDNAKRTTQ
ncbi:hypothetical protein J2W36_004631 [Variovorax ginsengisoli]|uniref:Transposase IS66 family protein n=1 Tax=Variovorax ginsengisoli TaxID=363844 RepID=A0ABT9SDD7_9BURK|nr:hypothetical protein [Variovorax ginsengisoli]